MASPNHSSVFLLVLSCLLISLCADAQRPPIAEGLSWTFYDSSCPKLESIIRKQLTKVFKEDIGNAAGLLRLHFHDCFVQGCDGSILLDGSAGGPSEKHVVPNVSLRAVLYKIIEDLRRRVHRRCGQVVSCADIATLAARDAVHLSGGPNYSVPLGRRDSTAFATNATVLANIPAPVNKTTVTLSFFEPKGLDITDTVALSGGHTIGRGRCPTFTGRLYPTQDPTMDKTFANNLKRVCPSPGFNASTVLDIRTPNVFDNKYFVDLMNRQGLFTSDQDLYEDRRTRQIVIDFAVNQTLFFEKFINAMIKMGQLGVLTGNQGEIRANCAMRNSDIVLLSSIVEPGTTSS